MWESQKQILVQGFYTAAKSLNKLVKFFKQLNIYEGTLNGIGYGSHLN